MKIKHVSLANVFKDSLPLAVVVGANVVVVVVVAFLVEVSPVEPVDVSLVGSTDVTSSSRLLSESFSRDGAASRTEK